MKTVSPPRGDAVRATRRSSRLAGPCALALVLVAGVTACAPADRGVSGGPSHTAATGGTASPPMAGAPSAAPPTPRSPAARTSAQASDVPSPDPGHNAALEVVMRQGTDDTLQHVVGFAEGTTGRVAAVSIRDGATIPATAPWSGRGEIYLEGDDGSWRLLDTGGTFESIQITELLSPPGGPMVIFGVPEDSASPREVTGAWTSADGLTWTHVDIVPARGIVGQGPLGYVQALVEPLSSGASAIELYVSEDGRSWELVHTVEADADAHVYGVGGGPEGFVVAARREVDGAPTLLASSDGRTWFEAPEQPALSADDVVMAVAPLGRDWVAAGWRSMSGPGRGIDLWTSADGLRWEEAASLVPDPSEEAFGTRVMYPSHLLSSGDILFLSTAFAVEGSGTRPRSVWTSRDGESWEQVALGASGEVRAVAETDCCLWLAGRVGTDEGEAAVWRWDRASQ